MPCEHVFYIQTGAVKLSVLSKTGREAVVAMLGPGEFFGEGCLAGQPVRMGGAAATTPSTILLIDKDKMVRLLHKQHAMSDRFITHMLARNIRIEQDLIDQLFNSSEKRLARALLLLARYGKHDKPVRAVPPISQETLARNGGDDPVARQFLHEEVPRLGFIDYTDGLKVNNSLLTVVLHESSVARQKGLDAHIQDDARNDRGCRPSMLLVQRGQRRTGGASRCSSRWSPRSQRWSWDRLPRLPSHWPARSPANVPV